jgi:hypothetical protein
MRGTGSHDVTVSDVFVPDEHTMSLHAPPVENGPLYALPIIVLASAPIAAVGVDPTFVSLHAKWQARACQRDGRRLCPNWPVVCLLRPLLKQDQPVAGQLTRRVQLGQPDTVGGRTSIHDSP